MKKLIIILLIILFGCSPKVYKQFIGTPLFECNFTSEQELKQKFRIMDNQFYNDILFRADMVSITPKGLTIKCIKESGTATTWQRTDTYEWVSGGLATWDNDTTKQRFTHSYGTWVIEAIFPETWAALWLLHPDYWVPEIGKKHITPEVDIAENNNGKNIDNVVHYGWDTEKYSTKGKLKKMHRYDGKLHQYAVELLRNGYNFYLDGRLINSFISNEPDFVSNQPNYLIINNAVKYKREESEFIIKNVKYYAK